MTQERRSQDAKNVTSLPPPAVTQELAPLFNDIAAVIQQFRQQVQQAVNSTMVQCYWHIGRLIVEHEQQGQSRAAYGKHQLEVLSEQLTQQFGKGFIRGAESSGQNHHQLCASDG
jgi:hypothetical protein